MSTSERDRQATILGGLIYSFADEVGINSADDAKALGHRIISAGFIMAVPEDNPVDAAQSRALVHLEEVLTDVLARVIRLEGWSGLPELSPLSPRRTLAREVVDGSQ